MTEKEYQKDAKTRAAVERYLEILGEAANKFPEDFYSKNAHIEWHKIIALRNRIIHAYFDVNNKIVWQVASEYLPKLRIELDSILKSL